MYDYGKVVGSYDYESIESNSTSAMYTGSQEQ